MGAEILTQQNKPFLPNLPYLQMTPCAGQEMGEKCNSDLPVRLSEQQARSCPQRAPNVVQNKYTQSGIQYELA